VALVGRPAHRCLVLVAAGIIGPQAGAYFVPSLTSEMTDPVREYLSRVDESGGYDEHKATRDIRSGSTGRWPANIGRRWDGARSSESASTRTSTGITVRPGSPRDTQVHEVVDPISAHVGTGE
jgi:hypothetical protein